MDDQGSERHGGNLRQNAWLNGVVILLLMLAALYHDMHAWDGGFGLAAGLAILISICIYLLSINVRKP